ncbi:glycosyltransferase [Phenylobacterium sp.]|uniref:glycosyltransferase n=1 Tax=Phenylobacterium sp. TaxID=1871053 RepID=UPI0027311E9C|nr:glycosyltransferase [Phenylobacterium sp.]MDP2213496.1 glycosyltransferase [Phenylobacterium sp.]
MRVALVHYWLVGMRGGERVLEAFSRMFPQADIFTHVIDPAAISDQLRSHVIKTTFINRLPFSRRHYQSYLPLMPWALEELDLSGYDLVISSESGPAKGIIPPPEAPHLCYCHSPMRYLWDQYHTYRRGAGSAAKLAMPLFIPGLRQWDVTSAARVDVILANSNHVAARVRKYWRREAQVVHPPVDVDAFRPSERSEVEDYYLWAGELVSYKRPDIAIEAFNRLGRKLIVIGGPDHTVRKLQSKAKDNITFLGKVPFDVLKHHMAHAKALVFPGEEDFGIVPVEMMASGRPVIAYGRGGALDTVKDGETGILFSMQTADGLIEAIERFEQYGLSDLDPIRLAVHAQQFSRVHFDAAVNAVLSKLGVNSDVSAQKGIA